MKDGALRLTEKHILSVTALSMPEKHLWHGMQVTQKQNKTIINEMIMKNLKENRNTFPNWMYCKKTEIDLSKSGTGLFPGAFYMNRHVKRVILPDYADTVPANLFKECINLKEVTLPMDPDIDESAFEGCISLTDIHISFYVGSIATNAFRGCRENIRFHADSPVINPERLKQHIEKELGHSIELYDISGNLVESTD